MRPSTHSQRPDSVDGSTRITVDAELSERIEGRHTMGRAEHIRRRTDFERVYQQGARLQGRYMTIFLLSTELPVARLGVAATKKLGGSVKRNYAKRLIREVFRRHRPAPGTDVVVVPRPTVAEALFSSLEADYCQTLTRRRTPRVV